MITVGFDLFGLTCFRATACEDRFWLDACRQFVVFIAICFESCLDVLLGIVFAFEWRLSGGFTELGELFFFGLEEPFKFLGAAFVVGTAMDNQGAISDAVKFDRGFGNFVAGTFAVLRRVGVFGEYAEVLPLARVNGSFDGGLLSFVVGRGCNFWNGVKKLI